MRVRVFASLREAAGASEIDLDAATVGELLRAAEARFGETVSHCTVVVNGEKVADAATPIAPTDEVALLPPVAGG